MKQKLGSGLKSEWNEVFVSLTKPQHSGVDATLCIKREIGSTKANHSAEFEDLNQISMNDIELLWKYTEKNDLRFAVKTFDNPKEIIFCAGSIDSCQQWVTTIKSARDASQNTTSIIRTNEK